VHGQKAVCQHEFSSLASPIVWTNTHFVKMPQTIHVNTFLSYVLSNRYMCIIILDLCIRY